MMSMKFARIASALLLCVGMFTLAGCSASGGHRTEIALGGGVGVAVGSTTDGGAAKSCCQKETCGTTGCATKCKCESCAEAACKCGTCTAAAVAKCDCTACKCCTACKTGKACDCADCQCCASCKATRNAAAAKCDCTDCKCCAGCCTKK